MLKKMNQTQRTVRETARLSCADCHVLDSGRGAHGGTQLYNLATTTIGNIDTLCQKCHLAVTYSGTVTVPASRVDHSDIFTQDTVFTRTGISNFGWNTGGSANNKCMMCHAAYNGLNTVTKQGSYGGIHGNSTWATYSAGSTYGGYRFFPGTKMKVSPGTSDAGWATAGTGNCYFWTTASGGNARFSSCSQHDGTASGGSGTYNYGRPLRY